MAGPADRRARTIMIDTHLHLWRLDTGWYGWNTPALGALHADADLAEVAPSMATAAVRGAVVVQAADTLAETDWLLGLAWRQRLVLGVVGYLPLADPAETSRLLRTYRDSPLVGVRQLWHDHDRRDELADPAVLASLDLVGAAGLVVDVPDAFPALWPALVTAVDSLPETTFVLDHCGKPPFGDPVRWAAWERSFADLASRSNVIVKLSGLYGGSGSASPATPAELARVVELTGVAAGADKAMIGSDWPMTRGRLGYAETLRRSLELIAGWGPSAVEAITRTTPARVYRLR